MVELKYKGKTYDIDGKENSTYLINNGMIIELERSQQETEKDNLLRKLLSTYGPLYNPSALEKILRDLNPDTILSDLENILRNTRGSNTVNDYIPSRSPILTYRPRFGSDLELNSHLEKTQNIIEVDYLWEGNGGRVLGMYDLLSDTIYVLRGLSPSIKRFVLAHEKAHRRRHFTGESQNERLVDLEAKAEVGYDPLQRFAGTNYGIRQAA